MRKQFGAAIVVAMSFCAAAYAADIAAAPGQPYAEARSAMVSSGWEARPSSDDSRCNGRSDVCELFPEVEECAGAGEPVCSFVFVKPDGHAVRVVALGEDAATMTVDNVQDGL